MKNRAIFRHGGAGPHIQDRGGFRGADRARDYPKTLIFCENGAFSFGAEFCATTTVTGR